MRLHRLIAHSLKAPFIVDSPQKLMQNVKFMTNPLELCEMLTRVGLENGFQTTQYGEVENIPLIALKRYSSSARRHIYISSGIHGDEPASIFAIPELISKNPFPTDANITICPFANPIGYQLKTRENANGIDLNRDFKNPVSVEAAALSKFIDSIDPMDLSICLHEDWESTGFYLYYIERDSEETARKVIESVTAIGPIDPATEIDGRPAKNGIIAPPEPFDIDFLEEGWPEAFYLYAKNPHPHFTLETPSALPMDERIKMTVAAVEALLA